MLTNRGPQVLEFNVRMGRSGVQVILPRLTSDFAELCAALAKAASSSTGRYGVAGPLCA